MNIRGKALIAAAVAIAVGAGATAYASSNWGPATVATPRGYFDFCQDKQLDIAGITQADIDGDNNGGNSFGVTAAIYENTDPGTPAQNSLDSAGFFEFVRSKSGVTTTADGAEPNQLIVTQYVEFRDAQRQSPTQIRCKMREFASLNTAGFQKNDDAGPASSVPWGFGAGTASGPAGTCAAVNAESVNNAWATLTEQEKDDAPFRPEPRDGDPANIEVQPDVLTPDGPSWTLPWDGLQADGGQLLVRGKASVVAVGAAGVSSDKFRGSHYCTFVAPEYLVDVFRGVVTPPAPPASPGAYTP
jgi:hypothetical protein